MTLGVLFSERLEGPEANKGGYGLSVLGATLVVFVAYIIQLFILGATEAAKRSPSGPRLVLLLLSISVVWMSIQEANICDSDQAWLLNVSNASFLSEIHQCFIQHQMPTSTS